MKRREINKTGRKEIKMKMKRDQFLPPDEIFKNYYSSPSKFANWCLVSIKERKTLPLLRKKMMDIPNG